MNPDQLTKQDKERISAKLADLRVQSMMFDMDIDIETWSIVEKSEDKEAYWLTKWKEKQEKGDKKHEYGE